MLSLGELSTIATVLAGDNKPSSLSPPPTPPWPLDRRIGPGVVVVGVLPGPLRSVGPGVCHDDPPGLGLEVVDLLGPGLVLGAPGLGLEEVGLLIPGLVVLVSLSLVLVDVGLLDPVGIPGLGAGSGTLAVPGSLDSGAPGWSYSLVVGRSCF